MQTGICVKYHLSSCWYMYTIEKLDWLGHDMSLNFLQLFLYKLKRTVKNVLFNQPFSSGHGRLHRKFSERILILGLIDFKQRDWEFDMCM